MSVKEMITGYMNLIARACAVVLSYSKGINDLCVVQDFNKTYDDTKDNIARALQIPQERHDRSGGTARQSASNGISR